MKIKLMNLSFYIAFILSILVVFFFAYLSGDAKNDQYVQIEVSTNDTIWDLAEKYASQHSLTYAQFIHWVEYENRINADEVKAGLKIKIPVKKHNIEDSMILVADGEL
ncbi:cell division suppressor protein YneA [Bacillus sp. DJP31]|uniref:cell division suppressor protein YneA n=1 Tax=Bacillus sp. DJP31 TaxID=3409789 RepID=UPI003BB5F855